MAYRFQPWFGDYIELGTAVDLRLQPVTWSLRFRCPDTFEWGNYWLLTFANSTGSVLPFRVYKNRTNAASNQDRLFIDAGGTGIFNPGALVEGHEYFIAFSVDAANATRGYLLDVTTNTETTTTSSTSALNYTDCQLYFGRVPWGTEGADPHDMDGDLWDVRCYNRALSLRELRTLARRAPILAGLVGWWEMIDGPRDLVGNNHGTLSIDEPTLVPAHHRFRRGD